MRIYRYSTNISKVYYCLFYCLDPLSDTNHFNVNFLFSIFVSDLNLLPPPPLKNIDISYVFHGSEPSVKMNTLSIIPYKLL